MKEFQERRFLRKIFFSKFTLVFLAVALFFTAYSTTKIYLRNREAASVNEMLKKEIEDLEAKKKDLSSAINRLESPAGQEEEIRSRFPVQKPGEKTVIIVEEGPRKAEAAESESSNFLQKIRQFMKSIF